MSARHRVGAPVRGPAVAPRTAGGLAQTVVVAGRWLVLAAWIGLAVAAVVLPAPRGGGGGDDVGGLLIPGSAAVAVQERSLELFQVPVLSDTTVVVHDPGGLDPLTRADVALWALAHTQATLEGGVSPSGEQVVAAVPIPTSTPETAVTYLYVSHGTSLAEATSLARQYASHFDNQTSVQTFVTGLTPARVAQAEYLESRLLVFELATLVLIAVVVGLTFRSVVAPVVVLFVAGLGYVVTVHVLAVAAAAFGFALPDQLRPLTAALLIGVVTDYCVLFFSGYRRQLDRGLDRQEAARRVVLTEGPIVAVAGVTVAAGTAALLVADFALFRAFGPALALTVVVGLLVSLTLVPAVLALLGPWLFAPFRISGGRALGASGGRGTRWLARAVSGRRGAVAGLLLGVAVLVPAALPLADMQLGVSFAGALPDDDPVRRGARVLEETGVRGITAPTEVVLEGDGVALQRDALARLQEALAIQPGVARVLGPAQNPLPEEYGVVFSQDGDAARFVVVFDSDPLAAPAVADLRALEDRLDGLIAGAGVEDVTVGVTGQTAIAGELIDITRDNLARTLVAVLLVELVILMLFLRALVAPIVLLVLSALGVAAALGLTVVVFQGLLGEPGLTFYVPFATAVLLLALGSDYNVFAVGAIWEQAARRPLAQAITVAMPATARAISAAGLILAATFAMVAIIPLSTFRQIAFAMAAGLLIDTFLIRPVLTPAALTLLGRSAGWPGRRIRTTPGRPGAGEQHGLLEEESVRRRTDVPARTAAGAGGRAEVTDGPTRPRPGRRSAAVLAVVVVLGTVLLVWAAERLARTAAESVLARAAQERTGVREPPPVTVGGGPVLLQALRGRYDDVDVDLGTVSSGPLRLRDVRAGLSRVYLPFSDLLDGNPGRVYVEQSVEEALLTYDDLDRYLAFTGRRLDAEPAGNGRLRLTGTVDVLGEVRPVSALVRVTAGEGALLVAPEQLDGPDSLEGVAELLARQRFTFPVPLDPLLFEGRGVGVTVRPDGLALRASGTGVVLGS